MKDVLAVYHRELPRNGHLSREESVRLGKLVASGDKQARDVMIMSCLKLVCAVAERRWKMFHENNHLMLQDMIQDGNIGLLNAVDHYDYRKGIKFSVYAFFWIEAEIISQLNEYIRPFHLPENIINAGFLYKKIRKTLCQKLGREPTLAELSEAANCRPDHLKRVLWMYGFKKIYLQDNLDSARNRGHLTYEDVLVDSEALDWLENQEPLSDKVRNCFKFLKPRERQVITKLFGIGCDSRPMVRIAEDLAVSIERVRQIKNDGLKTLAEKLFQVAS